MVFYVIAAQRGKGDENDSKRNAEDALRNSGRPLGTVYPVKVLQFSHLIPISYIG
jgi:hypothetical protein